MPFLMLWRVLTTSPSSPTRTLTAYSSAPRRTSSASSCGLADDPAALGLGLLGEAALVDEERGLLLGTGDDPLGLLLGLLDDPLALGVDPLRRADLLGDGDAQLVDEAEGGRLVDDDVVRQGQPPAVRDDRLEALDEEDDVDRSALRWRSTGDGGRWPGLSHGVDRGAPRGSASGQRPPGVVGHWQTVPAGDQRASSALIRRWSGRRTDGVGQTAELRAAASRR